MYTFYLGTDNSDSIAKDLVGAGLVDGRNLVVGTYSQFGPFVSNLDGK